jgi:spore coat polysaccharide biosynthesis predicted glycosyltransferase SpsG
MKNNVFFYLWPNYSDKVGFGHLRRLKNLSSGLKKKKINYNFILTKNKDSSKLKFKKLIYINKSLKNINLENFSKLFFRKEKRKFIIFDNYQLTNNILSKFKKMGYKTICFSDNPQKKLKADLNIHLGNKIKNKNFISGLSYIPFDLDIKKNLKIKRKVNEEILITFGAFDHYSLSLKVINILKTHNFKFKVVIGRFYKKDLISKLKKLKKDGIKIKFIMYPKNIINHIKISKIIICAGGFTIYEALLLKKNVICFGLWNNQLNNLIYLRKKKLIEFVNIDKIQKKLSNLVLNIFRYQNLAKSTKLIDHLGSIRIVNKILKIK